MTRVFAAMLAMALMGPATAPAHEFDPTVADLARKCVQPDTSQDWFESALVFMSASYALTTRGFDIGCAPKNPPDYLRAMCGWAQKNPTASGAQMYDHILERYRCKQGG